MLNYPRFERAIRAVHRNSDIANDLLTEADAHKEVGNYEEGLRLAEKAGRYNRKAQRALARSEKLLPKL